MINHIQVLDCTLRDGGYCNDCKFEYNNIKKIIKGLVEANIDIVECGFLVDSCDYDKNYSRFTQVEQFQGVLPEDRGQKLFVALMDYGKYDIDLIPEYDGKSIDGIRVAFHKKDYVEAIELCKKIKEKGYKVFVQGMVSLSYSDEEYLHLIRMVNTLEPYAFYIVDSFGQMKRNDLLRLFYIVDHNLKDSIRIGFHSHNNLQLAYSNAQSLVDFHTKRNIIIDSSVYGMGRGAGNLNTELFLEYLNDIAGANYYINPLLVIIDEILDGFYQKNYWGYSLPNYLSAVHGAHPNYASYFDNKKTLTVEAINEIFDRMPLDKRISFDSSYAEKVYRTYMMMEMKDVGQLDEFRARLVGKTVLLIAPGKSTVEEADRVLQTMNMKNVVSIGINSDYTMETADYIFLSNLRRYKEISKEKRCKCIVTSNISSKDAYLQVNYGDLVNEVEAVQDNAGLMAINLMIYCGVKKVLLAGYDGYSHNNEENYAERDLTFYTKTHVLDMMNEGMDKVIKAYSDKIEIEFCTKSRFDKDGKR